jgi:predicted dehydrogenase
MLRVVVTGLNGYGKNFVQVLIEKGEQKGYKLVGVISQSPDKSKLYPELLQNQINIYKNLEEALSAEQVEVVIVATPTHIHGKEVKTALQYGAHVFCEKPLTPTIDEALQIKQIAKEKGLKVAVGYQWSYAEPIQNLKKDLLAHKYGRIQKVKALVNWNRPKSYFMSSDWKGKNKDQQGNALLDCVLSNNTAHYLHNLFFLLGEEMGASDTPVELVAEGYKGNPLVQSYDTACIKIKTQRGFELLYLATIVAKEEECPRFVIECEEATITYNIAPENRAGKSENEPTYEESIIVTQKNGHHFSYGAPNEGRFEDIFAAMDAIKEGKDPVCSIETTLPHLIVVNAMKDFAPVTSFPEALVREEGDLAYVEGIEEILRACFNEDTLPSEKGMSWAKATTIDVRGYNHFKGSLI